MAKVAVGIQMLKINFLGPPGDIGHPATWSVPGRRAVVAPAIVDRTVQAARNKI